MKPETTQQATLQKEDQTPVHRVVTGNVSLTDAERRWIHVALQIHEAKLARWKSRLRKRWAWRYRPVRIQDTTSDRVLLHGVDVNQLLRRHKRHWRRYRHAKSRWKRFWRNPERWYVKESELLAYYDSWQRWQALKTAVANNAIDYVRFEQAFQPCIRNIPFSTSPLMQHQTWYHTLKAKMLGWQRRLLDGMKARWKHQLTRVNQPIAAKVMKNRKKMRAMKSRTKKTSQTEDVVSRRLHEAKSALQQQVWRCLNRYVMRAKESRVKQSEVETLKEWQEFQACYLHWQKKIPKGVRPQAWEKCLASVYEVEKKRFQSLLTELDTLKSDAAQIVCLAEIGLTYVEEMKSIKTRAQLNVSYVNTRNDLQEYSMKMLLNLARPRSNTDDDSVLGEMREKRILELHTWLQEQVVDAYGQHFEKLSLDGSELCLYDHTNLSSLQQGTLSHFEKIFLLWRMCLQSALKMNFFQRDKSWLDLEQRALAFTGKPVAKLGSQFREMYRSKEEWKKIEKAFQQEEQQLNSYLKCQEALHTFRNQCAEVVADFETDNLLTQEELDESYQKHQRNFHQYQWAFEQLYPSFQGEAYRLLLATCQADLDRTYERKKAKIEKEESVRLQREKNEASRPPINGFSYETCRRALSPAQRIIYHRGAAECSRVYMFIRQGIRVVFDAIVEEAQEDPDDRIKDPEGLVATILASDDLQQKVDTIKQQRKKAYVYHPDKLKTTDPEGNLSFLVNEVYYSDMNRECTEWDNLLAQRTYAESRTNDQESLSYIRYLIRCYNQNRTHFDRLRKDNEKHYQLALSYVQNFTECVEEAEERIAMLENAKQRRLETEQKMIQAKQQATQAKQQVAQAKQQVAQAKQQAAQAKQQVAQAKQQAAQAKQQAAQAKQKATLAYQLVTIVIEKDEIFEALRLSKIASSQSTSSSTSSQEQQTQLNARLIELTQQGVEIREKIREMDDRMSAENNNNNSGTTTPQMAIIPYVENPWSPARLFPSPAHSTKQVTVPESKSTGLHYYKKQ